MSRIINSIIFNPQQPPHGGPLPIMQSEGGSPPRMQTQRGGPPQGEPSEIKNIKNGHRPGDFYEYRL